MEVPGTGMPPLPGDIPVEPSAGNLPPEPTPIPTPKALVDAAEPPTAPPTPVEKPAEKIHASTASHEEKVLDENTPIPAFQYPPVPGPSSDPIIDIRKEIDGIYEDISDLKGQMQGMAKQAALNDMASKVAGLEKALADQIANVQDTLKGKVGRDDLLKTERAITAAVRNELQWMRSPAYTQPAEGSESAVVKKQMPPSPPIPEVPAPTPSIDLSGIEKELKSIKEQISELKTQPPTQERPAERPSMVTPPVSTSKESSGLALVGLVLGIIALVALALYAYRDQKVANANADQSALQMKAAMQNNELNDTKARLSALEWFQRSAPNSPAVMAPVYIPVQVVPVTTNAPAAVKSPPPVPPPVPASTIPSTPPQPQAATRSPNIVQSVVVITPPINYAPWGQAPVVYMYPQPVLFNPYGTPIIGSQYQYPIPQ